MEFARIASEADRQGDAAKTLRLDLLAIKAAQRSSDQGMVGRYQTNLAQTYVRLGDAPRAEQMSREAIRILTSLGNVSDLPAAYTALCRALSDQAEEIDSIAACRQAVATSQQSSNKADEARARNQLASTFFHFDRNREALEQYMQSLSLAEETGQKLGAAFVKNNIGNIFDAQGNYPLALRY